MKPSTVVIGIPVWPPHTTVGTDPLRKGLMVATSDVQSSVLDSISLVSSKGVLANWDDRRSREKVLEAGHWTTEGHMTGYYNRAFSSLDGDYPAYGAPTMSHDNARELRESIEELKREGANVILMIEPGRVPGEVSTIEVDSYVESIAGIAADLGVEMWDTYHLEWDPGLYADEAHFNRAGTVAFTQHVGFLLDQEMSGS